MGKFIRVLHADLRWDASLVQTHLHLFFFLKSQLAPLSLAGVGGGVPSSEWHVPQICESCLCQSLWPGDVALALFRALCE